ncbi:MAG: hypothetical protein HYT73_01940 [Candidatus Aenigmarchaeota archaeon]|nr:hypothetical protein [Candidatus Aenigmarchaeota archaeon]
MKLGEALSLIKAKKGYMASQYELMKEHMFYETGKKPEFAVADIFDNLEKAEKELRNLKISVMEANLSKKLENGMSPAEAIISIGDIRSRIAQMERAKKDPYKDRLLFRSDDKRIEYVSQVPLKELEDKIKALEARKIKLDAELQTANWNIDINHQESS